MAKNRKKAKNYTKSKKSANKTFKRIRSNSEVLKTISNN